MKFPIPAAVAAISLLTLAGIPTPSQGRTHHPMRHHAYLAGYTGDARSIQAAITNRLNHDLHTQTGVHYRKHIPFQISRLDIQGSWAHVEAQPLRYRNSLDRVLVLLHKQQGRWQVVQYGGGLSNNGLPRRLQQRWHLLPQ